MGIKIIKNKNKNFRGQLGNIMRRGRRERMIIFFLNKNYDSQLDIDMWLYIIILISLVDH